MNYSVSFSKEAQEELRETALYIQQYNPAKADSFVNSIMDYFTDTLGEFPNVGVRYTPKIRKLTHKKHTAFHTVNEQQKEVFILHVVDLTKPLEAREIEL